LALLPSVRFNVMTSPFHASDWRSWRRAGLFGCRSEPYTPISHVLSRCAWNQPDSRVTANERISRVNGRERNEDCDVIDRTRRQGDQKRDSSQIMVHSLPSNPERNYSIRCKDINYTVVEDSYSVVSTVNPK
jgi:hypothetical protein